VLRLVPVGEGDVREVDVERDAGLEEVVGPLEHLAERLDAREGTVACRVHVGEVEHRTHPAAAAGDLEHVVDGSEVADAAHHLDAEGDGAVLSLEPLA